MPIYRGAPRKAMPLGDTSAFMPTPQRPVRLRARTLPADTHFEPHAHAWAQLAYCATGIVQVTAQSSSLAADEITFIVPPSRAVWVAPGALHQISVLEAAQFRTLYIDASATPAGWTGSRAMVVSALLREVIEALDALSGAPPSNSREALLSSLVLNEISHASALSLGVPMPDPRTGDKRLRALCEAVLRAPAARASMADWAADVGASERTMARLFREELGLGYQQWRQQAVLAHALPLLAQGQPVSWVAAASGYASDSAFSAMFKAAMGQSPGHFQGKKGL